MMQACLSRQWRVWQPDCLQRAAAAAAAGVQLCHRASTSAVTLSPQASVKLAARAKKICAPKCIQRALAPFVSTKAVSATSLAYPHLPSKHLSLLSSSPHLSGPLFTAYSRRHHSSNHRPPTPPFDMDHLTLTQSTFDIATDSDPESSESSLPTLPESGHKFFQPSQANIDGKHLQAPTNDKKVFRIIVEGNIGCGKTTFLKIFAKNCASMTKKPLIVPEPIDLWRDVGGVNIFQLLADDPKRWSFAFQSYVQLTMIKIHEMQPDEGNFKVMERSLFSARYCFVENLIAKGLLQPCEYFILDEWFKASIPSAAVDLIIYLKSDPDIVYERIKRRGRPEEAGITLDYLRTLHQLHENWLVQKKFPLPAPVVTIDANTPLDQIVHLYQAKTDGILREHMVTA